MKEKFKYSHIVAYTWRYSAWSSSPHVVQKVVGWPASWREREGHVAVTEGKERTKQNNKPLLHSLPSFNLQLVTETSLAL